MFNNNRKHEAKGSENERRGGEGGHFCLVIANLAPPIFYFFLLSFFENSMHQL